jgi:hypothetical protein
VGGRKPVAVEKAVAREDVVRIGFHFREEAPGRTLAGVCFGEVRGRAWLKQAVVGYDVCSVAEFSLAEDWQRHGLLVSIVALAQDSFHRSHQLVAGKGYCQRGDRLEPPVPVQLSRRQVSRHQNDGQCLCVRPSW